MNLTNFAIIKGNGKIENGSIKYKANEVEIDAENEEKLKRNILDLKKYQPLLVRSDQKFSSGIIQFKSKLKSKNTGILLILRSQDGTPIICGATLTEHKFVIANEDDLGKWKIFSTAGDIANYNLEENLTIKIQIEGSSIKLFVNSVLFCESNNSIKDTPVEFRLCSDKDFEIFDITIDAKQPKIFIVMQFSQEYNELYSDVIQPVVKEFGFECIRGDEFYSGTPILKDIIDSISTCVAIIAEITPDNPNVFYEIGYSHAIGKPTILLCDRVRSKLPFDLSGFRTLFYENTIAGKNKVETSLRKYLSNI
jgi:hypothetical protein